MDYPLVRIYGVDCDQAKTVTTAAKRHNMTVFAGIFDLNNLDENLKTLIDSVNGDWSMIDTVSIGNELVNKGENSPAQVVDAVNSARGTLRAVGYDGPVVIVDTSGALIQHPELCQASDYCAANCHAFFDPSVTAEQAGPYVKEQAERVSAAAGGKRTVITESGWPYAGQTNGAAVPSRENQQIAVESLKNSFPDGGIILFTAFDDKWKTDNRWTFSTERFWGFLS
jgi:exo-beta-1,3-glucanase (GH17 family)